MNSLILIVSVVGVGLALSLVLVYKVLERYQARKDTLKEVTLTRGALLAIEDEMHAALEGLDDDTHDAIVAHYELHKFGIDLRKPLSAAMTTSRSDVEKEESIAVARKAFRLRLEQVVAAAVGKSDVVEALLGFDSDRVVQDLFGRLLPGSFPESNG